MREFLLLLFYHCLFLATSTVVGQIAEPPKAIDGQWGDWQFGHCSVTCGDGLRTKFRHCDSPAPKGGGAKCVGISYDTEPCKMEPCPIDGGWNDWSDWSECKATCGLGEKTRRRSCKAPAPQYGGQPCDGPSEESKPCDEGEMPGLPPCPRDGGWTEWYQFLPCPTDVKEVCGNLDKHSQVRQRFCTEPKPAYGGKDCEGSDFEYTPCKNIYSCEDGGKWSDWEKGPCSVSCGVGLETLKRYCIDSEIEKNFRNCSGPSEMVQECKMTPCKVDGGWSSWDEKISCASADKEDPCSGVGPREDDVRLLVRYCNNPTPQSGGTFCQGESERVQKCREFYGCGPVHKDETRDILNYGDQTTSAVKTDSNGFSQWTEWSSCDENQCRQTRWRLCRSERLGCYGNDIERRTCPNAADACITAALRTGGSGASLSTASSTVRFRLCYHVFVTLSTAFALSLL